MSGPNEELKPCLIRAVHSWCVDNGLRPMLIAGCGSGSNLPPDYAVKGKITLDLSSAAVRGLVIGDENIEFETCFGGVASRVEVKISDVFWIGSPLRGIGIALLPTIAHDELFDIERTKEHEDPYPKISGRTKAEDISPGQLRLV